MTISSTIPAPKGTAPNQAKTASDLVFVLIRNIWNPMRSHDFPGPTQLSQDSFRAVLIARSPARPLTPPPHSHRGTIPFLLLQLLPVLEFGEGRPLGDGELQRVHVESAAVLILRGAVERPQVAALPRAGLANFPG